MKKDSFLYNPKTYTISSLVIGYLLIGDLTANEQNALGNWFITIGQVLEGNSAYQQAIEEKMMGNTYNINSNKYKKGGSPIMNNEPLINNINADPYTINQIQEMINDLNIKLENLKNNLK